VSTGNDISKHKRVNTTFTAAVERRALMWLAERTPVWMTPDTLTGIGVLGSLVCFIGYWLSNSSPWWLFFVNFGLLLSWYGDSLDGTLARYRKIERPKFGFYIDHSVDSVAEFLVIIGIGLSPYLRLDIAAFALIGYLLMSVHVYLMTAVDGFFKISYGRFGPTELRIIIAIVNTAIFFAEDWFMDTLAWGLRPFDVIGIVIAAALVIVFLVSSARQGARLARAEKR